MNSKCERNYFKRLITKIDEKISFFNNPLIQSLIAKLKLAYMNLKLEMITKFDMINK